MAFFILLGIPLVLAVLGFILLKGITWKEFVLQMAAQLLVAGCSAAAIYTSNTTDTEIWNGVVTSKERDRVSCSHSYECHCRTVTECYGSGKNRHCSPRRRCQTCYEHSNDWNWNVQTSLNETITITRVDRQGVHPPPRWSEVRRGEPTASEHSYTNYIKAAPDTLFRHQGLREKFKGLIPTYPEEVHDYYRLRRLVLVNGATVQDPEAWNDALSVVNGKIGHRKQANAVLVLAKGVPADYFYALEEAWIGGKKNDVILVVGVDAQLKPRWALVMAWTLNELFKIKLRDDIMALPVLTKDNVVGALETNVSRYYKRKPMADFDYLQASITPTTTQWLLSLMFGLLVAGALAYFCHRNDIFNEDWRKTGRHR